MTPTVFLLAAGRSQRFNYRPKQLLRFRGETILQRTIRLIREINPDIPIYLVTWDPRLFRDDVIILNTGQHTPSVSAAMLFAEPYWDTINIFLTSDTVYYPDSLKEILSLERYCIIGRLHETKGWSERYGVVVPKRDHDRMVNACVKAYDKPGLRAWVGANRPWLYREFPKPLNHIRDFLFYHILPISKMTLRGNEHFEVTDDTDDIDSLAEYFRYVEKFG